MAPSAAAAASSSSSKSKRQNPNHHLLSNPYPTICCNHSFPAATLDLLLLIVVLLSFSFLIASPLSHLLRSLAQALALSPTFRFFFFLPQSPLFYLVSVTLFLLALSLFLAKTSRICSRKCANPKCKGLKKALEFDVQIQTEECLREKGKEWKEIEDLPWKGGQQGRNPDYELLRNELRKMSPVNGRAVLLFRSRCGCPIAKLEAWGPKGAGGGTKKHKR